MTSSGTSWARWVLHLGWVGWSSRVHVEAGECLWRQGCEKLACSSQRGSGGRAWKTAVPSHSPPTPPPPHRTHSRLHLPPSAPHRPHRLQYATIPAEHMEAVARMKQPDPELALA